MMVLYDLFSSLYQGNIQYFH